VSFACDTGIPASAIRVLPTIMRHEGYPRAGDPARLEHLILKLKMDYRDSGICPSRRRPVGRRHDDLKALEGIGTMRDVFTAGG